MNLGTVCQRAFDVAQRTTHTPVMYSLADFSQMQQVDFVPNEVCRGKRLTRGCKRAADKAKPIVDILKGLRVGDIVAQEHNISAVDVLGQHL